MTSEDKKLSKSQQLKQSQDDEELKECSFKPQLCKNSLRLAEHNEKIETKADKI